MKHLPAAHSKGISRDHTRWQLSSGVREFLQWPFKAKAEGNKAVGEGWTYVSMTGILKDLDTYTGFWIACITNLNR